MALEQDSILNDRYRILDQLGQGGMGAVYLAVDNTLDLQVAVKENLNLNPESERQFKREAALLAGLRHPNLPRVTHHFLLEGRQYLVMDFVEGEDLRARAKRQPPTIDEVLEWAHAVCDALGYLHSQDPPIIHRDIRPANIKLTPQGKLMLVDFGLAKVFDEVETDTGARGLTPGYSPPEQHGSRHTDARSDQYALAATLYSLLTGQSPADSIERMVGSERLIPARELNPEIPAHIDWALRKALSISKEDRFPDVSSFSAALEREGSAPLNWPSLSSLEFRNVVAWTERNWPWPLIGVVGLLVLIVVASRLTSDGGRAASPPASAGTQEAATELAARVASQEATITPTTEPTRGPSATNTAAPVPTAGPTPIELTSADDPRRFVDLSQASYLDSFDNPASWFDYDTEGRAAYTFENGKLQGLDYLAERQYIWWTYVERSSGNVYTEISATIGECVGKDAIGFAIRVDPETASGGYGVEVSCDGSWRFLRYAHSLPGEVLQKWTYSDQIESGSDATNRIALWGYGNEFYVFANNAQIGNVVDPLTSHSYGTFALYVRAAQTDELKAHFDDFAFYHIPYIPQ